MEEKKEDFIRDLKEEFSSYIRLRIELFRISSYEKIARVSASLITGLLITILVMFFSVFGSVAAGLYIGHISGSPIAGFGIVAGFYLLLLLIVLIFRKSLFEKVIINKMIVILFENESRNRNPNP